MFVDDLTRDIKRTNCGVPIGDEKCGILMYAYDVVILAESAEQLQHSLDILHTWIRQWRLTVNITKTKVMHCRKVAHGLTDTIFNLGDQQLDICNSYRYLGLEISEFMDLATSVNTLSSASSRAYGALLAKSNQVGGFNYATYTKLYTNCVVPVMDYASGIWGIKRYNSPDIVQRKVMRYFLGTNKYTAIPALEGDMGWFPPYIRHQVETVRLFQRLSRMPPTRLTNRIFMWDIAQPHGWSREVVDLIRASGFDGDLHDLPGDTMLVDTVRSHLETNYLTSWTADMNAMPKLRTYKLLKTTFGVEDYVRCPMHKSLRSAIARIRMGVFPLRIETGRWRGLPLEERLCTNCDMNEVENEKHFLCVCPRHTNLRQGLIRNINEIHDDDAGLLDADELMKLLLCTCDTRTIVGRYIISCHLNRQ